MGNHAIINEAHTLYRVGRGDRKQGLWYDADGKFVGDIHTLAEGAAGALPMGHDDIFASDNQPWLSATETLEQLKRWFSERDMLQLHERGYELLEYDVASYRRLFFPTYAHEVFSPHAVTAMRSLDPLELYATASLSQEPSR